MATRPVTLSGENGMILHIFSIIYIMRKTWYGGARIGLSSIALLCAAISVLTPPSFAQDSQDLPGILGTDNRKPIDSSAWPWSSIGRINRTAGGFCTGTLIATKFVLTAAHCMYDSATAALLQPRRFTLLPATRETTMLPILLPETSMSPMILSMAQPMAKPCPMTGLWWSW
ncbi:trypsin-like serine protease [Fodinicurvata halophila]|uniref:trypsin-like serine protease n=1 Tax=Fodinicurvata halophila TaxID=1419723 RepID=UPI0036457F5F